jgi:hypothetical protein
MTDTRLRIAGILLLFCIASESLHAQQLPALRFGIEGSIGTKSGLGYKLPYTSFELAGEKIFANGFEIQAHGGVSPTAKYVSNDGLQVMGTGRVLYWFGSSTAIAAAGGVNVRSLATSLFTKHDNSPSIGVVRKVWWLGLPNRLYLSYLIPTGARPIDGSLQSNRTQGIEFIDEVQHTSRIRMSLTFDVLTFLSQSGAAPSPRSWTGTVMVMFRFGSKQDPNQLF